MSQNRRFPGVFPTLVGKTWNEVAVELQEFLRKLWQAGGGGVPAGFLSKTPSQVKAGTAANPGTFGGGWAAGDHVHDIKTAAPSNPTGTTAAEGTSTALMRADAVIQQGVVTTKGDLLSYGTTPNRLPVGTNQKHLEADSSQTLGVAWVSDTFTKGGSFIAPSGASDVTVWRAPFACTVTNVRGYRHGGTGATINARKNGSSSHLSSDLSLTSADTWTDGGSVQNTSYSAGDSLEVRLITITGTPNYVTVEVDFTRP